jgi:hypothetical protein
MVTGTNKTTVATINVLRLIDRVRRWHANIHTPRRFRTHNQLLLMMRGSGSGYRGRHATVLRRISWDWRDVIGLLHKWMLEGKSSLFLRFSFFSIFVPALCLLLCFIISMSLFSVFFLLLLLFNWFSLRLLSFFSLFSVFSFTLFLSF